MKAVGTIEQCRVPAGLDAFQELLNDHFSRQRKSMLANKSVAGLGAKTAAELDALLPSILDKAFKGEL